MIYDTLDQDLIKLEIAQAIITREREIFNYQFNIDNYNSMLAALPQGEWPPEFESYRGVPVEAIPMDIPIENIELISDYNYRDRLKYLIRTETIERNKSIKVLEALKARLTSEELSQLLETIKSGSAL